MEINIKPCKITTSFKTEKIYPELEELEVIPKVEEQNYKGAYREVTVQGVTADIDEDIKPENIKAGVNILGVDGGYEGIDTSKATATNDDILFGKTAYVNNELVEGNIQEYDGSFEGNVSEGIKITDASYLFSNDARIGIVDELLGLCENVTTTKAMFEQCSVEKIDLPNFDTSNVTDMQEMFYNCSKLANLDLSNFDTSKVLYMDSMFYNCTNLTNLDMSNFGTTNVIRMKTMFYNCSKLANLDLSNFDMSNTANITSMFYRCTGLVNLKSFKNLGKGYNQKSNNSNIHKLDLSSCTNLSYESLIDVINNGLYDLNLTYDVANGGTLYRQSLVLGSTNLAKLTADETAIAINKGWDVS